MRKEITALFLGLTLGAASLNAAAFDLPKLPSAGGGGSEAAGDIDAKVKAFTDRSVVTNKLVGLSLLSIERAYATDEERAGLTEKMKALNSATDPKEINAQVTEIQKTDGAKVEELAKAKDTEEKTKKLDAKKQKEVAVGVGNFILAGLQAIKLTQDGQAIVSSIGSNPMNITKVIPVKDALPILADAASTSTKVMSGFTKVLKGANVQVAPVTAESKPAEVKF